VLQLNLINLHPHFHAPPHFVKHDLTPPCLVRLNLEKMWIKY